MIRTCFRGSGATHRTSTVGLGGQVDISHFFYLILVKEKNIGLVVREGNKGGEGREGHKVAGRSPR